MTAGQALGFGIAGVVNVMNPARVILFLPPPLGNGEPGSAAELYLQEMRKMVQTHAFSDASRHTPITVQSMTPDERRFRGAKAAALRVLDSFIQHAVKKCGCYLTLRDSDEVSNGTDWPLLTEAEAIGGLEVR